MTPLLLLLILSSMLLLAALVGPRLIARSAPALASTPRIAAAALSMGALLWITGLLFLGPVVAWIGVGPQWLPAQATEICQRCLIATSPFGPSELTFIIPAFIPLSVPFVGVAFIFAGLVREFRRRCTAGRALLAEVEACSSRTVVQDHHVWLSNDEEAEAFALPARRGGIVISRGTLELLSPKELESVLAHEQAHLDQRHHLWLTFLFGATHYFRWIPVVEAVRGAVPPFLEIAADQEAGRSSTPTRMAAALLKLGELEPRLTPEVLIPAPPVVFNAVGSERVRSLVGVPHPKGSRALAATLLVCGIMLLFAVGIVHWPYVLAILTGC